VRGTFDSDIALHEAVRRLTAAGFDRAHFTLPQEEALATSAGPEISPAQPPTEDGSRQLRTLETSATAAAAAMAGAAVVVATGGAAAVAVAAAAGRDCLLARVCPLRIVR